MGLGGSYFGLRFLLPWSFRLSFIAGDSFEFFGLAGF